ncbi:hypothetical protein EVAR_38693_1 [Eumeta japonica]|uniref:Uncharacterized protein n=1 Tax=Eumeta variegata TaxID=151549 RepID=A0A4C1XJV0_EUMVA|nr:hypothetical protein EVAR_38693_1 [Eumeta japonica]
MIIYWGNCLIINEQFGFRPNHSCPQQALRLVEHISEGFKFKRKTVAVFFDDAKAPDKVNKASRRTVSLSVPRSARLSGEIYYRDHTKKERPAGGGSPLRRRGRGNCFLDVFDDVYSFGEVILPSRLRGRSEAPGEIMRPRRDSPAVVELHPRGDCFHRAV